MELLTRRLRLQLQTRDEVERMIVSMSESDRSQISPDWLAALRTSPDGDPWMRIFRVVLGSTGAEVGSCSFKGPPDDGVVEIAYGIGPDHQGNGYATEAAQALVDFASSRADVHLVRAHTLPKASASQRVLVKCGFDYVGETIDPEDGVVSRFERAAAGE